MALPARLRPAAFDLSRVLALAWCLAFIWRLSKPPSLMFKEMRALFLQQGIGLSEAVRAMAGLWRLLGPSALLAGIALGAWTIGERLARGRLEHGAMAGLLLRTALGMAVLMFAVTAGGMAGLFRPAFFWGLWLALALAACHGAARALQEGRDAAASLRRGLCGRGNRLLAAAAAALAMTELAFCLTPEVVYDALMYHLALARLYVWHGGVIAVPWNVYSQFPFGLGMLYSWGLGLAGDETLAKLLHWMMGWGAAAAAAALAARWKNHRAAWLAALFFSSMPVVILNATAAMSDLAVAFFALTGYLALEPWLSAQRPSRAPLALSGILCGSALACKYTAGFAAGMMGLLILSAAWRRSRRPSDALAAGLVFGSCALMAVAPWLVKNLVLQGNPISPFAAAWLGQSGITAQEMASFKEESAFRLAEVSWRGWLRLPWLLSVEGKGWHHWVGPAFWLFAGAAAVGARATASLRRSWAFAAAFYAVWSWQSHVARYLLPALGVLAALYGTGLAKASERRPWGAVFGGLFAWTALLNAQAAVSQFLFQHQALSFLAGRQSRESYLATALADLYPYPSYAALSWSAARLPADARLLFIGETRGFHSPRRFLAVSTRNQQPLLPWVRQAADSAALARRVASEGVTHFLVNEEEARRTGLSSDFAALTPREWALLNRYWFGHVRSLHRSASAEIFEARAQSLPDSSHPPANPFWDAYWKEQAKPWESEKPEQRRRRYQDLKALHPDTSVSYAALAREALIANQPQQTLAALSDCPVASDEIDFMRGAAYVQLGRWGQAKEVLAPLWERRPDVPAVRRQLDRALAGH